jgi:predicted Zn-dependent protease
LAARAGYDIAAAPALWSRLNNTRIAPGLATTHPTGPAREAAIRKAVQEIRGARP